MRIAVLNDCFFAKSHLERLKKLGKLVIYENTTNESDAIKRLSDVDIGIADCFITPLNKKVLESTNKLKLLAVNSTGYDLVDIAAAKKKGIKVSNVPNFGTDSVAEQAIALMFAVNRNIVLGDSVFRKTLLEIDPGNIEHKKFWGFNFRGKTMGVIGLGNIGTRVAELAQGLGMKVIAYNRSPKKIKGVTLMTLKEVLKLSDVVSINLALSKETQNIIGEKELNLMKHNAILINTARGKHVDTEALFKALQNKKIAGAGLDVVADINPNHPILKLDNV
ncbi:3-phosphoglycerate dehydrogenase, partial [archaeon]|nr:3-phosphoglycerate dehydrogenase [archaeon]